MILDFNDFMLNFSKNKIYIIIIMLILAAAVVFGYLKISGRLDKGNSPANKGPAQASVEFNSLNQGGLLSENKVGKVESAKDNPNKDSNADGITDKEAVAKGLNPYRTDNDGDGIFDIDEIKLTKTDPLKADTDGDGLNDLDEINKYRTDPLKADSNGDGIKNGQAINSGQIKNK